MTQTTASIPVDLKSPGQVLACMGFLEAAEVLLGGVEAHFDWSGAQPTFVLRADGDENPFEVVLEFLSNAKINELTPIGYVEGGAADGDCNGEEDATASEPEDGDESDDDDPGEAEARVSSSGFPSGEYERKTLPVLLVSHGRSLSVSHWADGSSRSTFKTFAGQQRGAGIAKGMRDLVRSLFDTRREDMISAPFDVTTPIKGKFGFDPRSGWTPIDAGYSPDEQGHRLSASPAVELLAAIGLEYARLDGYETRDVHYAVWGTALPPMLARAAISGADLNMPTRRFGFELRLISKKYKVTTFAQEENQQ